MNRKNSLTIPNRGYQWVDHDDWNSTQEWSSMFAWAPIKINGRYHWLKTVYKKRYLTGAVAMSSTGIHYVEKIQYALNLFEILSMPSLEPKIRASVKAGVPPPKPPPMPPPTVQLRF